MAVKAVNAGDRDHGLLSDGTRLMYWLASERVARAIVRAAQRNEPGHPGRALIYVIG